MKSISFMQFCWSGIASVLSKYIFVIAVLLLPSGLRAEAMVKPSDPLTVSIEYETTSTASTYVLHVYLLSQLPDDINVSVNVSTPEQALWLEGEADWQGLLHSGEVRALTLTGQFSLAANNTIVANVSSEASAGVQWAATATLQLPGSARSAIPQLAPQSDERLGQPILTFSLDRSDR